MAEEKRIPGIRLQQDAEGKIQIDLITENSVEPYLSAVTPAEALLMALDVDYTEYRRALQKLQEHSLFEPKLNISLEEYEDFITEAVLLPAALKTTDPISYQMLGIGLESILQIPDDGSASFLIYNGARVLRLLTSPLKTQLQLRNIFEVTFDDTERLTQQERMNRLSVVYPQVVSAMNELGQQFDGNTCMLHQPGDLLLLELYLYFQQEKQRIARCQYCWEYFIPKTKKETLYCDRISDGKSCKRWGPNLMRKAGPEIDGALAAYNSLRNRMMARLTRYEDAAPWGRERLIHMDYAEYEAWLQMANAARKTYLQGKLTAEQFLQKIDVRNDLESYTVVQHPKPEVRETEWRRNVERNLSFDSNGYFQDGFMSLDLDAENPQWETKTAKEQMKAAKGGYESLREKFKG